MTPENTQKLLEQFPRLYRNLRDMRFECQDGWISLIHDTSLAIEQWAEKLAINPESEAYPKIVIVKAKMGYLKMYFEKNEDDEVYGKIIDQSVKTSLTLCEFCGVHGAKMRQDAHYFRWVRTLCEPCAIKIIQQKRLSWVAAVYPKYAPAIDRAVALIQNCDGLIITAGAGMSADSGLPTFRGTEGLWEKYPGLGAHQMSFQQIANPTAFANHPHLAWGFYGARINLYRRLAPHDGYAMLLEMAQKPAQGYFVFTSNVDGHFEKAGFAPERMVACHGSILHGQCSVPCCANIFAINQEDFKVDRKTTTLTGELPKCPKCGALARPQVLMFDDDAWINTAEAGIKKLMTWRKGLSNPLVIELGAGTAIPTVRHFSGLMQCPRIRVNPEVAFAQGIENGVESIDLPFSALTVIIALFVKANEENSARV